MVAQSFITWTSGGATFSACHGLPDPAEVHAEEVPSFMDEALSQSSPLTPVNEILCRIGTCISRIHGCHSSSDR